MVGGAILRKLVTESDFGDVIATGSSELDLRNQAETYNFVNSNKPKVAILSAARVGGVYSNLTYPAIFALENQLMQANALQALVNNGVEKVIFIGSSCIYPSNAPLPLSPASLNTGEFEPTNKWYAMAKLSMIYSLDAVAKQYGIKVVTLLPTNLYGPGDNFHVLDGHVIPSLMIKAHKAKVENLEALSVWGSGKPMREVLYVDDFADAVISVLRSENSPQVMNVGSGEEYTIQEMANEICNVVGFQNGLSFDTSKPDGAFRKPLDSSDIRATGWAPKTDFRTGLSKTYDWFIENKETLREKGVIS